MINPKDIDVEDINKALETIDPELLKEFSNGKEEGEE